MQTINFETAQKIQELGVKKDSYMVFLIDEYSGIEDSEPYDLLPYDRVPQVGDHKTWHAYTLDEIWGMLPEVIDGGRLETSRSLDDNPVYWFGYGFFDTQQDENPAESAARLLILYIENKHIKPEEL